MMKVAQHVTFEENDFGISENDHIPHYFSLSGSQFMEHKLL